MSAKVVIDWFSLVIHKDQFLTALPFQQRLDASLAIESQVAEDAPEFEEGYLLLHVSPLHKPCEQVFALRVQGTRLIALMALPDVVVVLFPFHPTFHVPAVIVGHVALTPTCCECLHVQLVATYLLHFLHLPRLV